MKSMAGRAGLLSLIDIFQRLLAALTGKCSLFPGFFFFPVAQGFLLLRATGFLIKPDVIYRRHPALESKKISFLSALRTSLFSV
jgi:hypothetical protein